MRCFLRKMGDERCGGIAFSCDMVFCTVYEGHGEQTSVATGTYCEVELMVV